MSHLDRLCGGNLVGSGCTSDGSERNISVSGGNISTVYFLCICICSAFVLFFSISQSKVGWEKDDTYYCNDADGDFDRSVCESGSYAGNYESDDIKRGESEGSPLNFALTKQDDDAEKRDKKLTCQQPPKISEDTVNRDEEKDTDNAESKSGHIDKEGCNCFAQTVQDADESCVSIHKRTDKS